MPPCGAQRANELLRVAQRAMLNKHCSTMEQRLGGMHACGSRPVRWGAQQHVPEAQHRTIGGCAHKGAQHRLWQKCPHIQVPLRQRCSHTRPSGPGACPEARGCRGKVGSEICHAGAVVQVTKPLVEQAAQDHKRERLRRLTSTAHNMRVLDISGDGNILGQEAEKRERGYKVLPLHIRLVGAKREQQPTQRRHGGPVGRQPRVAGCRSQQVQLNLVSVCRLQP